MKTATLIADNIGGFAGYAAAYELSEPLLEFTRVTVFESKAFGNVETVITPSGGVSIVRLPGSVSGFTDHAIALGICGYTIVRPGEVVRPAENEVTDDHNQL